MTSSLRRAGVSDRESPEQVLPVGPLHFAAGGGGIVSVLYLFAIVQAESPANVGLFSRTLFPLVFFYGVFTAPLLVAYGIIRARNSEIVWPYYVVTASVGGFGYVAFLGMWGMWGVDEVTPALLGGALFVFVSGCFPGLIVLGIVHVLPRWLLWTLALPLPAGSLALTLGLALL